MGFTSIAGGVLLCWSVGPHVIGSAPRYVIGSSPRRLVELENHEEFIAPVSIDPEAPLADILYLNHIIMVRSKI